MQKGTDMTIRMGFTALVLSLALAGCTSMDKIMGVPTNEGNGYPIEQVEKSSYMGRVTLKYVTPAMLEELERKESELAMKEADQIQWPGGYFVVRLDAYSLDSAKGKWLEIVVKRGGEEVSRQTGTDSVPNVPSSSSLKMWWTTTIVPLEEPITNEPVDVYVIHTAHQERDHFRVSPQEKGDQQ